MDLRNRGILAMDYGLCRFCNEMKKCRVVNFEYQHKAEKEIYTDMLMETFGLLLLNLDSESSERLICATCVVRLRAACAFKRQVLQCEERLLSKLHLQERGHSSKIIKIEDSHSVAMDTDSHMGDSESQIDDSHVGDSLVDDSLVEDSQMDDSLVDDSQIDDSHVGDSQIDGSHVGDSQLDDDADFFDVEVLDESLLASDDENIKSESQEIEISVEPIVPKPKTSQQALTKKPSKPKKPSEPNEEDTHVSGMKCVLAYRNQPTKEVMQQRMQKLRALIANNKKLNQNKPTKPVYIHKRTESKNKEIQAQANTVMVVENSYVTPFNNITGNYYCYYCRSIFTDPAMLREHNLTHDPKPYFLRNWSVRRAPKLDITRIDCRLCDARITTIPDLKDHLTTVHKKKFHNITNEFLIFKLTYPEVACMECGDKFFFIDKLIDHMAEHFGKYICDKCGAAFVQHGSLQAHVRCHNKPNIRFPCHICGKSLTTNRSRRMHIATVHEKKNLIECYKCEERFLNYEKRNKHMEEAHGYVRTIPCPHCDRTFETRKNFLTHLESKHSANNAEYQCEQCEKTFTVLSYMKKHVRLHHNKSK